MMDDDDDDEDEDENDDDENDDDEHEDEDENDDDDDDDDYRFFICRHHNCHSYKSPTESMGQTVYLSTLIP